jgi:hypothetical protein
VVVNIGRVEDGDIDALVAVGKLTEVSAHREACALADIRTDQRESSTPAEALPERA